MRSQVNKTIQSRIPGTSEFRIDCLPFIFTFEELEILKKEGHVLKALSDGTRNPGTGKEKSFVQFIRGQKNPTSVEETAWIKYLNRRKLEASLFPSEELCKEYLQNRRH